jgi:hypothetical protein
MNPNCISQSKPTPVMIRPFLKVTEKRKSTGRRRGKSTIPTSEKLTIEARKSVKPAKIAKVTRAQFA